MQIFAQVVSIAIAVVGIALFVRAIRQIIGVVKMGQPAHRTDNPVSRTLVMVKETLGHTRMLQWKWVGVGHWFVFTGFGLLFFTLVTAFGQLFDPHFALPLIGHFFLWEWAIELFTLVMIVAITAFIYYRATRPSERTRGPKGRLWGSTMWQGYFVEMVILGVGLCIVALRGLEYALLAKGGEYSDNASPLHFPLSFPVGKAFEGLSAGTLENLIVLVAMLKILISFAWMITLALQPTMGVAWHRFLAFFNIYFKRNADGRTALGALTPMTQNGEPIDFQDLEEMDEDTVLGVGKVEDFTWKGLLDFNTCTECGRCQSQCPAWNTEKPLSPKLLITAMRDHAFAKAPYLQAAEGDREALLEGSSALKLEAERPLVGDTGDGWFYNPESGAAVIDSDVLWDCTNCGACVQQCPVDIEHVDHIIDMRRYQVLVESNFPSELNGLFKGLENKGNPWNMSPKARMDWAKDLPFDVKVVGEDVESLDEVDWLFWVGCAGAYEDRAKKTTRAVAELLDMAGVSFAVLGNGETCTGDPARRAGNEFVFQGLATQNVETFKETKAKKVVSTCAHCFNTLKNEYAAFGVELEVVHHTQLLNRLVRDKKLVPVAQTGGPGAKPPVSGAERQLRTITYHDPCFIGRHNGVYSPPRELLSVIPDADLVEMPRNSERSFCCGAGGARMWMEENTGERINVNRTKEAVETGADQIAVGCPFCRVMLSDGLTAQQAKGEAREEVEVLDVAQMLLASIKGESKPSAKKTETNKASAKDAAKASDKPAAKSATADEDATKAEPDAGDATQTDETVTDTEDAGPLAKASGGSSLFDTEGDSEPTDETPADTTVAKAAETPDTSGSDTRAADSTVSGGGSLFDLGGDETGDDSGDAAGSADKAASQTSEKGEEPEKAEKADASSGGAAPTPTSEVPEGGSLFDIAAPEEEGSPAPTPDGTPQDEDAAADSTTDGDTDRSQDAADTDIAPDQDNNEPDLEPETEAATSSGTTATPAPEIPEGGSLFDIEAPAEESITKSAPTAEQAARETDDSTPADGTPQDEDAAADSTTDGDTDRSQDAADTDVAPNQNDNEPDVEPDTEPETGASDTDTTETENATDAAPTSSGTTATPAAEIPEGGSLFDIEAPAEESVTKSAPTAEQAAPETDDSTPADGTPQDEDAAADSTTDGDTDRSQDAADTDVAPDQDNSTPDVEPEAPESTPPASAGSGDVPLTSLRDIKAKYADGTASSETGSDNATARSGDSADSDADSKVEGTDEAPAEHDDSSTQEDSPAEEERPKPAGSGPGHQPRTDTAIGEGGSLFDL